MTSVPLTEMHNSTYSIPFYALHLRVYTTRLPYLSWFPSNYNNPFRQPRDWGIKVVVLGEKHMSKEVKPSGNSSEAPIWWTRDGVDRSPAKTVLLRHL